MNYTNPFLNLNLDKNICQEKDLYYTENFLLWKENCDTQTCMYFDNCNFIQKFKYYALNDNIVVFNYKILTPRYFKTINKNLFVNFDINNKILRKICYCDKNFIYNMIYFEI